MGPQTLLLALAFVSMGLLAVGLWWRDPRAHHVRAAGWVLFGLFWPFQASKYFANDDPFNAYAALLAPLLTGYIAFHEYRSHRWGEDPVHLRWLTGATFVAATTYFVLFEIKPVTEMVIYWTGVQSSWMLDTVFGASSSAVMDSRIGSEGVRATHLCLADGTGEWSGRASFCDPAVVGEAATGFTNYAVTIIFACTALQSIMIFVGAIGFTSAPAAQKWKAYAVTAPTIYVLNLFRNAGIVYGYKIKGWTMFGLDSFEFMHSYIAKTGALVALVVIALAVFRLVPQLHENVLGVLALPKRRRPHPGAPSEAIPALPRRSPGE